MWCVVIQPKGTTRNALLQDGLQTLPSMEMICGILRRATAPELIGTWKWREFVLHLYAYKTGKAGSENKHELPPPHDKILLFGEAVILGTKDGIPVNFSGNDYTKFCEEGHGGFEDIGSEDSDTDDESDGSEETEEDALTESESESETESIPEEAEEEEECPVPIKVVKPPKRNVRKIQHWYSIRQLDHESFADEYIPTNPIREKVSTILTQRCKLSETDRNDLERGLFNFTIDDAKRRNVYAVWENPEFQTLYQIHAQRVISNLDKDSYIGNGRLYERMMDGEFKPSEIPYMSYSDLFPEKWGNLIEMAIKRESKMLEVDKSMATDMFKCTRCGKRQCTYYEMQTRSADEPMTQFIRCLNCGKQWRQ